MTHILVIDDDPDMAELLGHMSDILGFTHRHVQTGEAALEACRQQAPDVVILDVMLEDTDGWAVFNHLASATRAPIIFITAWRTGENRQKAEALMADGFLSKPISHQDFAQQIRAVLNRPARRFQSVPR